MPRGAKPTQREMLGKLIVCAQEHCNTRISIRPTTSAYAYVRALQGICRHLYTLNIDLGGSKADYSWISNATVTACKQSMTLLMNRYESKPAPILAKAFDRLSVESIKSTVDSNHLWTRVRRTLPKTEQGGKLPEEQLAASEEFMGRLFRWTKGGLQQSARMLPDLAQVLGSEDDAALGPLWMGMELMLPEAGATSAAAFEATIAHHCKMYLIARYSGIIQQGKNTNSSRTASFAPSSRAIKKQTLSQQPTAASSSRPGDIESPKVCSVRVFDV